MAGELMVSGRCRWLFKRGLQANPENLKEKESIFQNRPAAFHFKIVFWDLITEGLKNRSLTTKSPKKLDLMNI